MKMSFALLFLVSACGPSGPNNTVTATIDPAEPTTRDALTLIIRGRPGPEFEPKISWTRDGVAVPSLDDSETVPVSETTKGEEWGVTLITTDGQFETAPALASTTIINSPPTFTQLELNPALPTVHDPVAAVFNAEDLDEDELTYTYEWRVDGAVVSTEATLPVGTGEIRSVVELTMTATDGEATAEMYVRTEYENALPTAPRVQGDRMTRQDLTPMTLSR